jgi:hypothetical protein
MAGFDKFAADLESKLAALTSKGFIGDEYIINNIDLRKRAPNAIRWIVEPQFLNIPSVWKHVRQYEVVRDFFQLRCPMCNKGSGDCWGKTPEQLQAEILLEWDESVQEDRCPSCKTLRSEFIADGMLKKYDTMIGVAGMRSGKSVVAGMIGTYMRHVYTCMGIKERGTLHRLFDLLPTQNLEIAFVATTATQAKETIWVNFQRQCAASPWFANYVEWVVKKMNLQVTPEGSRHWVYKELEDSITDDWLMINFFSLNSNSAGMAGRTRLAFFIDELSRFGVSDSKMGADEVWAVFEHSLRTVRGARRLLGFKEPWLGTGIAISSPMSIEDKTMVLYNQAADSLLTFGWKYPTWLFNPYQPRESFDEEYKRDAVLAERDFGANPPNATNPLIMDPLRFWSSLDQSAKPTAVFNILHPKDKSDREYVGAELETSTMDRQRPLYIFGDAGRSFDQFALVACSGIWLPSFTDVSQEQLRALEVNRFGGYHPNSNEHLQDGYYLKPTANREGDGERQDTLVTMHEWSLRIIPEPGRPVWFESVLDIMKKLVKYRKVAMVAFDTWNSESTLQKISDMGVPTQPVHLKIDDFVRAVQDTLVGRLKLQPPKVSDKLSLTDIGTLVCGIEPRFMSAEGATIYELLKLERDKELKSVSNPKKGLVRGENSDDLAHCLVGAHRLVQESAGKVSTDAREQRRGHETAQAARFQGGLARNSRW